MERSRIVGHAFNLTQTASLVAGLVYGVDGALNIGLSLVGLSVVLSVAMFFLYVYGGLDDMKEMRARASRWEVWIVRGLLFVDVVLLIWHGYIGTGMVFLLSVFMLYAIREKISEGETT